VSGKLSALEYLQLADTYVHVFHHVIILTNYMLSMQTLEEEFPQKLVPAYVT
jgi:hypothetical protein